MAPVFFLSFLWAGVSVPKTQLNPDPDPELASFRKRRREKSAGKLPQNTLMTVTK